MINKDSIVTAYDEHLTLVEWLQKVETALKDAVLTGVTINKKGNATLSFVFTFEDGTTLETDDLILQQGESVQSATIRNGHLILTLTNGDELDAGDLGGVSGFSIDASQHLIVTYQNGTTQDLGAIFTGNVNINGTFNATSITGGEIIETPLNYGFEVVTSALPDNLTFNATYAGVVKNGNKVTFSLFANVTRTGELSTNYLSGALVFNIPKVVSNKIYPFTVGSITNACDSKYIQFLNTYATMQNKPALLLKYQSSTSRDSFILNIYDLGSLTLNQTYIFRYEVTFLLSDNLAG